MSRKLKRNTFSVIVIVSFLLTIFSVFSPSQSITTSKADNNPAAWVLCNTDDGKQIYNAATTDLIPYSVRSKSNINKTDNMDSFLNLILNISGFNFYEVNKQILGRDIVDKSKASDKKDNDTNNDDKKEATNANATAPKVTPFDRFGMTGLKWSSYTGEWKYYQVDGCANENEVSKTEFGVFYKNRKEPKASFNETGSSKDPRVIQYNKGTFFSWSNAFNNMITNGLFNVSKVIVTITIALIGLSFSDVTTTIGLGNDNGSNGLIGMFSNLYTGFFTPLVVLAFLFTAIYVLYYGLLKRQLRQALISGLGQTILCLFMAIVIGSSPATWIPIPNQIATFGQALIVSSLGANTKGQNSLCGTNIGEMNLSDVSTDGNTEQQNSQMEKISSNMRSTIGCRMWEEFLLKPWARGQFGSEYDDLTVAGVNGAKLQNINSEWAKTADVPLGGNVIEHNLALFQVSTQSEAHAQIDGDTGSTTDPTKNKIVQVDGVSSDWWRIADILSNYDEQKVTSTPAGGGKTVETDEQVNVQPLNQWQDWVGNKPLDRYGVALLSILFGALGCIGPLVFGAMTVIFSVGVTLLMAISPIFFLLGCWAGKGQELFRGWLAALASTILKKIVSAGLLIVSFAMTLATMNLINVIGWLKAFFLLAIMTYILIKNKRALFDIFSKVNFGSSLRPDQMFSTYMREKTKWKDEALLVGESALIGGRQARKQGMKFKDGASIAAKNQLKNTLRKTRAGRAASVQLNANTNEALMCMYCGTVVNDNDSLSYYFLDDDQNPICANCAVDIGEETELYKIPKKGISPQLTRSEKAILAKRAQQYNENRGLSQPEVLDNQKLHNAKDQSSNYKGFQTSNDAWLSYTKTQQLAKLSIDKDENLNWDNDSVNKMIYDNMRKLNKVATEYDELWKKYADGAVAPAVPEPISRYVSTSTIDEAWRAGNYNFVKDKTIQGWHDWYSDNSRAIANITPEEREATLEYIDSLKDLDKFKNKDSKNVFNSEVKPNDGSQMNKNVDKNIPIKQSESSQKTQEEIRRNEFVQKIKQKKEDNYKK